MKKPLLILFILFSFYGFAHAQDFPYGKITDEEMDMKNYSMDTSAHAVVLREYGSARIDVTGDNDETRLIYNYHVKIKIFDTKGFDEATIGILLGNDDTGNYYDKIEKISGVTFYKDANGGIQEVLLDPQKLYTSRENKYYSTSKFTMPGLIKGCVIEYSYSVFTPFFQDNFHSWNFQSDIPKIYSEYNAFIPGVYT